MFGLYPWIPPSKRVIFELYWVFSDNESIFQVMIFTALGFSLLEGLSGDGATVGMFKFFIETFSIRDVLLLT
jgi:hypothetical protein